VYGITGFVGVGIKSTQAEKTIRVLGRLLRINKLEQCAGTGGRELYRWCHSDEDTDRQLKQMKANGELKDGDAVGFARWLSAEEAREQGYDNTGKGGAICH
jgi:hypothetical protein